MIFADEAQDLNKLQLALIRKWGNRTEYFIVAGGDDQTIYSFTDAGECSNGCRGPRSEALRAMAQPSASVQ